MKKSILTDKAPAPIGPYSQAVLVDGTPKTLYVSGQIPLDAESGALVTSSIEAQAQRVMKNIQAILEKAEMSFKDVVKCSIFITDMNDFGKINEIYGEYFSEESSPARETVQVSALPKGVNVEISCIAIA